MTRTVHRLVFILVAWAVRAQMAEAQETEIEVDEKAREKKRKETATEGITTLEGAPASSEDLKFAFRLFTRAELQRRDINAFDGTGLPVGRQTSLDLGVVSARFAVRYRSPIKWLTVDLEADLADKPYLKDAFAQAKGKHVTVRAGQFRMPISAFEMESPWRLPVVRRGFLHDLLVDALQIAGRRPGATLTLRAKGDFDPRLVLGAFQGSVVTEETLGSRDTDFLSGRRLWSQNLVARAQAQLGPAEVGGWYENRLGSPALLETRRYWTAGLDATLDRPFSSGGVRAWLDGMMGSSWFEQSNKVPDGQNATFVAARLLVAWRIGGVAPEDLYVEPFVLGGVLDPDTDITADEAWEAAAGINVGLWSRARLTLQAEANRARRNFPVGYTLGRDPDRIGLLLQAGVAF